MTAIALVRRRLIIAADAFAEIAVWQLPRPLPPSWHMFKYRLAYVVAGRCVLRYDNEFGKGDHRHAGGREKPYDFSTPEQLVADFEADIARWNRAHGRT